MAKQVIKTCEEYVLNELKVARERNEDLLNENLAQNEIINELKAVVRDVDSESYLTFLEYKTYVKKMKEILGVNEDVCV